jgi:hypothetical protein
MNLRLTGTETINLTDRSTAIMTDFKPGKSPVEVKEVELFADVIMIGTRATIQTNKDKIDAILSCARRAQLDLSLTKIYVEVETDGTNYLRSEIVDGKLETDSNFFDRVARNYAPVRLWLKRKNYWEGAEAQIPLTNENGTDNTAGLAVYNTNDMTGTAPTKRVNYVKMLAASVTGAIPTPPRIEITNTYDNGTARVSNIWMGLSIDDATYPLVWFIDQTMTLNTTASTEQQIKLTSLSTAFLNGANGAHYRVFTKCSSPIQDLRLNAALYFPDTVALTPMQKAPEVVMGYASIIDLGTLQIPPWLPTIKNQAPVGLYIGGRRTGGFNITLSDVFLFPANAFRQLIPRGYGIAYTIRLVDDGITDTVWTDGWGAGGKTGHYSGYGEPIKLTPGKDQRLLFLNNTMTSGIDDAQTMSLKVYYRPRRLTP